jgi:hypothetical protein
LSCAISFGTRKGIREYYIPGPEPISGPFLHKKSKKSYTMQIIDGISFLTIVILKRRRSYVEK